MFRTFRTTMWYNIKVDGGTTHSPSYNGHQTGYQISKAMQWLKTMEACSVASAEPYTNLHLDPDT